MSTRAVPPELADAMARIEQAKQDYVRFVQGIDVFLYNYVRGMVKGFDSDSGGFVLRFRHPKESNITGTPRVLVAQIVEHLRTALDYMVFALSEMNDPQLNDRTPQFVIAATESEFMRQIPRLRYLTTEQRDAFVEPIQPYNGNEMLGLLADMVNAGKHRRLLSVWDSTGFDIFLAPAAKQGEFAGYFRYPVERDHAVFAKPRDLAVRLMEKYDALGLLKSMIEHVEEIVRLSSCFFIGEPFRMTIIRPDDNPENGGVDDGVTTHSGGRS